MRHLLGYGNRTGVAYFALNLWIDPPRSDTLLQKLKTTTLYSVEIVFVVDRFIVSAILRSRALNALLCTILSE